MKKMIRQLFLLGGIFITSFGYCQEQNPLSNFDLFTQGTWLTEGEWSNGQKFKQEIDFSWGLDQKILKVKTYGTIDPKTNKYGLRNEGIRAYNAKDSLIQFWEFDVYGGITEGICYFDGKNLHYEYDYNGSKLKESWLFIDQDNYSYQIASLVDGKVDKVYMKSSYKRISKKIEQ